MKVLVVISVLLLAGCGKQTEVRSILCTVQQQNSVSAAVSCPDGTTAVVTAPTPRGHNDIEGGS